MNAHGIKRVIPRMSPSVLDRQPAVLNLGRVIRFSLDGQVLERRLVLTSFDRSTEISTASPVGRKISNALPGQSFEVHLADGDLVVKVLSIL
jgi:transcription elongation GreA/GreB family factor